MTYVGAGTLPATSVPVWVSRAGAVLHGGGPKPTQTQVPQVHHVGPMRAAAVKRGRRDQGGRRLLPGFHLQEGQP